MSAYPLRYIWEGDAFKVVARHAKEADRRYVIGAEYPLDVWEDRSESSHGHEFAWVDEAWKTLPENLAENFPTPTHLRKRALIDAGYFNEQIVDAGTNAAALRVASAFRARDDFLLVIVRGAFVSIREAKSQSHRAMNKAEFQASKTAILERIADLIGVEPAQLVQARAA